jgi:hypothetical protein
LNSVIKESQHNGKDISAMFRAWYHACQLASAAFVMALVGTAIPMLSVLRTIGLWVFVPVGVAGALLGILGVTRGIRSACPMCGEPASWVGPAKHVLAVDCEKCGLVGGNPLMRLRPRLLRELYEGDNDQSAS